VLFCFISAAAVCHCLLCAQSSVLVESPHQQTASRFKPRPPGSSSGGSASSTPHSISIGGGSISACSSGGGSAASLQPHPPQSCRKAAVKGSPGLPGAVTLLQECSSPRLPPLTNSPVPGSSLDSVSGGNLRRKNYSLQPQHTAAAAAAGGAGGGGGGVSGGDGTAAARPDAHRPVIRSSSFAESHQPAAAGAGAGAAVDSRPVVICPNSPARTPSGIASEAFSRQNSGGMLPEMYPGQLSSPVGSASSISDALAAAAGSSSVPPSMSPLGGSSSVPITFGSSYSRPSSGKGRTVCLLVKAVRSRDCGQLEAILRHCVAGRHGVNDQHPITERWVGGGGGYLKDGTCAAHVTRM
jgi:hypothetical protein